MKAEHRHQLHTNLLADRMSRILQSVKSTPRTTSTMIWVFVLVALGLLASWQYWSRAAQVDSSAAWTQVDIATHELPFSPERLLSLGNEEKGTLAGRTATFQAARKYLSLGTDQIVTYRHEGAIPYLKAGLRLYTELAPQCPDAPLLEQEALMAIAKAKESLMGVPAENEADERLQYGSLDQAREAYQRLQNKFPQSTLGDEAAKRLKEFDEKGQAIEDFYKKTLRAGIKHPDLPKIPEPVTTPLPETPLPVK